MVSTHDKRYHQLLRRLRQARAQAGLRQEEVARSLGKPQSYVSRCESGERRIDAVELIDFARLYGVEAASLLEDLDQDITGRQAG